MAVFGFGVIGNWISEKSGCNLCGERFGFVMWFEFDLGCSGTADCLKLSNTGSLKLFTGDGAAN